MLDWKKKLKQGTLLFLQHWIFQKSLIHHFVWFLRAEPFIDSFKYSHATVPKTIPIVSKPAQSCEKPGEPFKIYYESFPTPRGHGARCFVRNMLPWRNRAGEVGGRGLGGTYYRGETQGWALVPFPIADSLSAQFYATENEASKSVFRRESPFHSHWQSDITSHLRATTRWSLFCRVMVAVEDALNR